jgi:hypothetical protein
MKVLDRRSETAFSWAYAFREFPKLEGKEKPNRMENK